MAGTDAYIGLGSNLADPLSQLARAVSALASLPKTHLVLQSPFYASTPVGPQDQPDFVNGAVHVFTELSPLELLDALQAIEQDHQRKRIRHWGPRTLDLDLLLYDNRVINEERLTVPHPEISNRDFVLQPLLDLDANLTLPDGRSIAELREQCPDNNLRRLHPVPGSLASPGHED